MQQFKFLLMCIFVLFLSVSCAVEPEDDSNSSGSDDSSISLDGYWVSSYGDGFEIDGTSYTQYDDSSKSVSFAGEIETTKKESDTTGHLLIKITDGGTWGKTVDAYFIIRWKAYNGSGIQQAAAYKSGSSYNNGAATAAEAEAEFTESNGYFSYYGEYAKQ